MTQSQEPKGIVYTNNKTLSATAKLLLPAVPHLLGAVLLSTLQRAEEEGLTSSSKWLLEQDFLFPVEGQRLTEYGRRKEGRRRQNRCLFFLLWLLKWDLPGFFSQLVRFEPLRGHRCPPSP